MRARKYLFSNIATDLSGAAFPKRETEAQNRRTGQTHKSNFIKKKMPVHERQAAVMPGFIDRRPRRQDL